MKGMMKKGIALFLSAAMMASVGLPASAQDAAEEVMSFAETKAGEDIVRIPDQGLKNALLQDGDKNGDGEMSISEMAAVEYVYAGEVSDLTGLEYAVNMKTLDLSGENLSDISALGYMKKLSNLYLRKCNITDISPLKNCKDLGHLDLSDNNIKDISPLKDCVNLTSVELGDNQITDVSALSNLKNLTRLYLHYNKIADISKLSGLQFLESVALYGNPLKDITPLKGSASSLVSLSITDLGVTKEMLFDVFMEDKQERWLVAGNQHEMEWEKLQNLYLTNLNSENEMRISHEDITWTSADPAIAVISGGEYPHLEAKGIGTTTVTAMLGKVKKTYTIHVEAPADPITKEGKSRGEVETDPNGDFGTLLDNEQTLWNIDGDKVNKVQSNVSNYLSEVVYEWVGGRPKDFWLNYYTIDEKGSLWLSGKTSRGVDYTNKKLFDNVAMYTSWTTLTTDGKLYDNETKECLFPNVKVVDFDYNFAVAENGDVYSLETKDKITGNVKKYFSAWDPVSGSTLYQWILTKDNVLLNWKTGEKLAENVQDMYYDGETELYAYLTNSELHFLKEDWETGKLSEVKKITGVKRFDEENRVVILNDGGFGKVRRQDEDQGAPSYRYDKISDAAFAEELFIALQLLLDEKGTIWYFDNESKSYTAMCTDVREMGLVGGMVCYVSKDNQLFSFERENWVKKADNVAHIYTIGWNGGYYYLTTDDTLYEVVMSGHYEVVTGENLKVQKILTNVAEVAAGTRIAYITRKDGSIWKYDGSGAKDGRPYIVMEASGEAPDSEKPVSDPSFKDVTEGAWYTPYINYVFKEGLMTGLNLNYSRLCHESG